VQSGEKTWPLVVNVKKLEKVKVKAGKFLCYRVEPVLRERGIFISKGKKLEVWMTADARHMPVLMRSEIFIGHVSAELVKMQVPDQKKDPQQLASSSASTAQATDVYAPVWNPAGLGFLSGLEFTGTHLSYLGPVYYEHASVVVPVGKNHETNAAPAGLGASVQYLGTGNIDARDAAGN